MRRSSPWQVLPWELHMPGQGQMKAGQMLPEAGGHQGAAELGSLSSGARGWRLPELGPVAVRGSLTLPLTREGKVLGLKLGHVAPEGLPPGVAESGVPAPCCACSCRSSGWLCTIAPSRAAAGLVALPPPLRVVARCREGGAGVNPGESRGK